MKKITASVFVFTLFLLSGILFAEKKGAEVIVEKNDGREVKGELIAVKMDSLLLMDSVTGADATIGVADIRNIKVTKGPKTLIDAGLGFLAGAGVGSLIGMYVSSKYFFGGNTDEGQLRGAAIGGAAGGLFGGMIGGTIGAHADRFETFPIAGRSEAAIRATLADLRKRARISDYQ
ncbi:MAG: hypothetical protein JXB23_08770 [Candidatus Aminicenantes bacterium]|nr:hypothetical protein [Candidatus Aminicenantes bacterium]